jgi:hypothetical protein
MGRVKITRLFVLLALAALLAPPAVASRTSVWESNPPASIVGAKTDAASMLASLAPPAAADIEAAEPPPFDLGDVVLVDTADADAEHFNLGPLTLVDLNLLRGPPPSYPETRVGGFELLPPFRVGASPRLSLWGRQACGFVCREVASDSRYDPWGLESSGAFTGNDPENQDAKEALDPKNSVGERLLFGTLGLLAGPAAGLEQGVRGFLGTPERLNRNVPAVVRETKKAIAAKDTDTKLRHGAAALGAGSSVVLDVAVVAGLAKSAATATVERELAQAAMDGTPSGKPEWLRRVERGNDFNRARAFDYEYREVYIENPNGGYFRLDGYNPQQEIVSRKLTQLWEVDADTGVGYVKELAQKYPAGARIANVPSSGPLAGQRLQGQQILEVPFQTQAVPQPVLDAAQQEGILIRDVYGNVY